MAATLLVRMGGNELPCGFLQYASALMIDGRRPADQQRVSKLLV
jgi:hypothetical protein